MNLGLMASNVPEFICSIAHLSFRLREEPRGTDVQSKKIFEASTTFSKGGIWKKHKLLPFRHFQIRAYSTS